MPSTIMSGMIAALAVLSYLTCLVSAIPVPSDVANIEKRVTHQGRGTWFYPGLGNCGWHSSSSDKIVAISKRRYDAENGSNCGQWMQITNTENGHQVYAKTVDSCESCTPSDIDMSPGAFKEIAPLEDGQLVVQWHFMGKDFNP